MGLIVHKYGGTSVGTPKRIQAVADRAVAAKEQGDDLVIVVSAMGDFTDELTALARQVTNRPNAPRAHPREMDMLLTAGERITMALLAMAIRERGPQAVSFTGSQAAIITDGAHTAARITEIRADRVRTELEEGRVVIVAGFQGVSPSREVTTLGRGGSDTTAVALAAALQADRCDVFTDVPGIFSADPRKVPEARVIRRITYAEMIELSTSGAGVMHPRAIEIAARYDVPVTVRSSFDASPDAVFTTISSEPRSMEDLALTGIASRGAQAWIIICGLPSGMPLRAEILRRLSDAGVSLDMIGEGYEEDGRIQLQLSIDEVELETAMEVLSAYRKEGEAGIQVRAQEGLTRIGVVGSGMHDRPGVYARIFEVMRDADVEIVTITSSAISIGLLVPSDRESVALRALHEAFHFEAAGSAAASGGP